MIYIKPSKSAPPLVRDFFNFLNHQHGPFRVIKETATGYYAQCYHHEDCGWEGYLSKDDIKCIGPK